MGAARENRVAVALAAALVLVVAACSGPPKARTPAPVVGTNVSGLMLQALDGGDLALGKLRGKVVVLHLFTTWSVASQVDVEKLSTLHDQYALNAPLRSTNLGLIGRDQRRQPPNVRGASNQPRSRMEHLQPVAFATLVIESDYGSPVRHKDSMTDVGSQPRAVRGVRQLAAGEQVGGVGEGGIAASQRAGGGVRFGDAVA